MAVESEWRDGVESQGSAGLWKLHDKRVIDEDIRGRTE